MIEWNAHCTICGSEEGVEAIRFDTLWQATFIKLTCGHTVKIETIFKFLTQKDLDELFPGEEEDSSD